jgi:ADP-heptose:LPS heptosyltransferase
MRCLIISTNALGDTYLSCSAIESLKKNFPEIQIDIIAYKPAELFLPYLDLDNIYYLSAKKVKAIRNILREIKNIKYDYTFCFFPGLVNTFFFLNADSKIKSGFINYIKRNEWFNTEQKLTVKGIAGSNAVWTPDMNFLDRIKIALKEARINFRNIKKPVFNISVGKKSEKYILLHPASMRKFKSVKSELLDRIISLITIDLNYELRIITSASDELELHSSRLKVFSDLSFDKLLEQIINSEIFIGVDSFPMHIADAYDKKLIGLFTETNPKSVFQSENKFITLMNENENIIKELSGKIKNFNSI